MCGDAQPDLVVPVLRRAFQPDRVRVSDLYRGEEDSVRWPSDQAA